MRLAIPSPLAATPARARIEHNLDMLTRLAEIGMELAEAAGRAATSPQDGQPDPALTYSRAARAVRLTIALQSRLLADLAALDRDDAVRASARRHRIRDRVEQAIEAERDDADEIERLSSAAWERLTDLDDADIADLPLGEAVALICRELGLSPAETASTLSQFAEDPTPTSLPFMGRVEAKPPGGASGWPARANAGPAPLPP